MKNELYEINIKKAMPRVKESEELLRREIGNALSLGYKVIKIIHGYGSHGIGGSIKIHTKKVLSDMIDEGKVQSFVCCDEWNVATSKTVRELLRSYEFLKNEKELFSMNPGITIASLELNTSYDDSRRDHGSSTLMTEAFMKIIDTLNLEKSSGENPGSTASSSDKPYNKYHIDNKTRNKGNFDGKAVITYSSGLKYDGQFSKSLSHGKGTLTLPDGTTYVGSFRNGRLDGFGELTYTDSKKYSAMFNNGKVTNIISVCFTGKKARRNPNPKIDKAFFLKSVEQIESILKQNM